MRSKRQGRPAGKKKGAQPLKIQPQHGGGSKGSTGGKGKKKRPIDEEEDDEEIDEDMAFDEEDERKYGDLLREISENDERKRKRGDEDDFDGEDEDDDDEDDDEEEEGTLLLSDLLGGSSKKAPQPNGKQHAKQAQDKEDEEDEEGSEDGDDDDEDDDHEEDDDEEDGSEEEEEDEEEDEGMDVDHAGLLQMVEGLAGKGQKGSGAEGLMSMELQNMPDSAFRTGAAQGLTLEAMLDSLKDTRGIAAVRKQLVSLSQSGKAVSAPAPTIVQERAERQVVYGEKKKAVGEWLPLVSSARQADTLNFSYEPRQVLSQAELVGKFEAETEMELAIKDLLTHAKADKETKVEESEAEALAAKGFTVDQVKARQAELAKMRALLFYEQQKRNRINKIKSKAYHRIRKRQRLRKEEGEHAALREADPEAAAALDEKAAIARVQERMSLRHKNTSKWARHVMQHGAAHQGDTRKAIAEQLQMGEELRKRAGALPGSDSEEGEDSGSESDEEEGEREARLKRRAADKIRGVLGEDDEAPQKGILGMKFMQRAVEKQRERAKEEMEAVLRELEQGNDEESDSEGEKEQDRSKGPEKEKESGLGPEVAMNGLQTAALAWGGQGTRVRVSGPITVGGGGANGHAVDEDVRMEEQTGQGEVAVTVGVAPATVSSGVLSSFRVSQASVPNGAANGKPAASATSSSSASGGQRAQVGGAGNGAVSNPWLEAPVPSRADTRKQQKVVASVGKKKGKSSGAPVLSTEEAVAAMEWDEDEDGEGEEERKEQGDGKGARVIIANTAEQKALVKRAFGAPDLEEDFAQEKAEQVQKEREEEEKKRKGKKAVVQDAVMGWGCWAGPGAVAPMTQPPVDRKGRGREDKPPQKHEQMQAKPKPQAPAPEAGELVKPRVDDKLPTVLINERRIKQTSKYKLGEVPYPFTSREQYERSLRLPVGKEWNTTTSVREATRAPVIVKPGTIVEPIKLRKTHRAVFGGAPVKP